MLHNDPVIMNFEAARTSALEGIVDYLENRRQNTVGDRYGPNHGPMGKRRAWNLGVLLSQLHEDSQYKNANILALLLAVFINVPPSTSFFRNPFRNIGRSSKLASYIADQWIAGEIDYRETPPGSVTSHVFSTNALEQATRNRSNDRVVPNGENSSSYFDKTKGAREILKSVLNSPMFQNERDKIIESLPNLRNYLECNNERVFLRAKLELPFPVSPADEMGPTLGLRKMRL